jgi:hypothetical protein
MLEAGQLGKSLRTGVVRLLPKVPGVPTSAQLRPITLLTTDYKLLTKMLVARLLLVLPSVLQSSQLCSVNGRSIFEGAASILSSIQFHEQQQQPGFLASLDFYHAYDRVCMRRVDKVLEAMGFGDGLRRWVAILHQDVSATFMLHSLSPELAILFSVRQGDPLAMILYIIQMEPFLVRLEASLKGLHVGVIRELSFAYVDDINVLSRHPSDLLLLDDITRQFEASSGAILNRNRKTVILGFGTWTDRHDWPLPWIQSVTQAKVFGVTFAPSLQATLNLS